MTGELVVLAIVVVVAGFGYSWWSGKLFDRKFGPRSPSREHRATVE